MSIKLPFTVEVTQEDINKGCPNFGHACPVALALKRLFPTYQVIVNTNQVTLHDDREYKIAKLPPEVVRFVYDFDYTKTGQPITFTITDWSFQ